MFKLKRNQFLTLSVLIVMFVISQAAIHAATLNCSASATLEDLYDCIYSQMRSSGDGIIVPTAQQLADLRTVMGQMLDGQTSITLPASLSGIMEFRRFTDSGNNQTYSVLMEVEDADNDGMIDRGFGTFIVCNEAEKEMNIASPHPLYDQNTGYESIRIFKYTSSRSFSLAGTHRHASSTPSSCQSSYMESDAAHNEDLMFFAASQELMDYYSGITWFQIQYHGMAIDSCTTNVFMSHGEYLLTPPLGDTVYTFRNNVVGYNPSWDVDIDGGTACTLDGGSNTSGRLINGVAASQVCGVQASNYGETFIHIEQDPACRTASDWIAAVNDTFTFSPPNAPGSLSASATAWNQIDLTWVDNSTDETLFYIERSANGADFSQIASVAVNETSYSDTTVSENTTYWHRVKAGNSFGYSSYSNIASETTPIHEWTVLTYDDFEVSFGNYTDGGGDCALYTGGSTYAHQGANAVDIQDNSGTASSFYHTAGIDVHTPGYTQIKVEFWFKAASMETNEDFWVQYYNGSTWTTVASYKSGADFSNGVFYNKTVLINESSTIFPTGMKIRFMCDASDNTDDVYIDEVKVSAKL